MHDTLFSNICAAITSSIAKGSPFLMYVNDITPFWWRGQELEVCAGWGYTRSIYKNTVICSNNLLQLNQDSVRVWYKGLY